MATDGTRASALRADRGLSQAAAFGVLSLSQGIFRPRRTCWRARPRCRGRLLPVSRDSTSKGAAESARSDKGGRIRKGQSGPGGRLTPVTRVSAQVGWTCISAGEADPNRSRDLPPTARRARVRCDPADCRLGSAPGAERVRSSASRRSGGRRWPGPSNGRRTGRSSVAVKGRPRHRRVPCLPARRSGYSTGSLAEIVVMDPDVGPSGPRAAARAEP
jgi:hypothetical protein